MLKRVPAFLAATSLIALAASASAQTVADNSPPGIALAHDAGLADPSQTVTITVHLKSRNEAAFKAVLDALYDPASPSFHRWLTDAQLRAFAPPSSNLAAVKADLENHGLAIVAVGKNGFSLRARGTLGNVARAFNTEIHNFTRDADTFRANIRNASLGGAAGSYVSSVGGLESHRVRPLFIRAVSPATGTPYPAIPLATVTANGGWGSIITDQSLSAAQTFQLTSPDSSTTATYTGIVYDENPALLPDFTAAQLQGAYGLHAAYKQGLDGSGQTIVLLESYGYPTAEADANAFSKLSGLPQLNKSNFRIVYPEGKPTNPNLGVETGWNLEIALDVQWTHSIAPGAKIVVVATNGQDDEDFQTSMQYIIDNHLGYAVSDSWETGVDVLVGPSAKQAYEDILQTAAAQGVSFQFSTGDYGDSGVRSTKGSAGVPSDSPHATAVGGTTIFNEIGGKGFQTVGWGNVASLLSTPDGVFDPPEAFFESGAGGGGSIFWPKPAWQSSIQGVYRQTPDVSALADPETGVPIVITEYGIQGVLPGVGGTSLASPIFTAMWAIAQQKAGHPLGQAAPTIAALTTGINDVLPLANAQSASGSITDSNGTTQYSTKALFPGDVPHNQKFIAPIQVEQAFDETVALGFALDTSLTVTKGWDNVTGFGTPDGLNFILAAAAYGTN